MRLLLTLLLPLVALAQETVVGNPTGTVLGIFAMCGTNPVDCNNGWCCLTGQICTNGPRGANTQCIDPNFSGDKGKGVTVNAAFFGKMISSQTAPINGSIPGKTTIQQQAISASSQVLPSASYVLLSSFIGITALLV